MTDFAVIDDSDSFTNLFQPAFLGKHTLVGMAKTRDEGFELAQKIVSGEIVCDVLVLDRSLSPDTATDGDEIAAMIRTMKNPPHIIGVSAGDNSYADETMSKNGDFSILTFRRKLDSIEQQNSPKEQ